MGGAQSRVYYCSCCGKNITGVVSYYDKVVGKYKCINCVSGTCPRRDLKR